MTLRHDLARFLAVVLIAVATSFGTQRYLDAQSHKQQQQACIRQNRQATESNRRIHNSEVLRNVLLQFTSSAAKARIQSYVKSHDTNDLQAAKAYEQDNYDIRTKLHYKTIPLVHCP